MSLQDDIEIRPYRAGDEVGILATFNRVFREVCGEGFVDRDLAFWRWEFADCPAGQRIWVAVTPDGTIAAHYAAVPHRMHTIFGERTFLHIVDSMVHPDHRAGLKRPGLFVLTGQAWHADCRARGDAMTYGYPVVVAERIGARYLDYRRIRCVDFLVRDLGAAVSAPASHAVVPVQQFDERIEGLFARVAADKRCLTHRDRAFMNWRYARIPGDPYVRLEARRGGQLAGVVIVRVQHELIPGACTIADWVVPTGDEDCAQALLAATAELGRAAGRRVLMTVFADTSPEHAAFLRRGFRIEPSANTLERRLNHVQFAPELTTEWLAEHWWYTLGDSDLV